MIYLLMDLILRGAKLDIIFPSFFEVIVKRKIWILSSFCIIFGQSVDLKSGEHVSVLKAFQSQMNRFGL